MSRRSLCHRRIHDLYPAVRCGLLLIMSGWLLESSTVAQETAPRYDIVLHSGILHVGDGSDPTTGHVAIRDGKIAEVLTGPIPVADIRIDCSQLVVCPGFIDLHNHSDRPILKNNTRANINYLLQGCTTVVTGNCGAGPVDAGAYLAAIDRDGAGTNVAHLLPQGSLRSQVMGKSAGQPTDAQLQKMLQLAEQAMRDGVFGMATGLIYIPGSLTDTEELIQVASVVGRHDGIYASHIRNEGSELLQSVDEAIRIGSASGCPVHISHFKASGRPNWGTLSRASDLIEQARAAGQRVTADQYPYIASSTSLEATLLPQWCREGGRSRLQERLEDQETAARIHADVSRRLESASRIQLVSCQWNRSWIGRSIQELAEEQNRPIVDVVLEIERHGGASVVNFGMSEDDLRGAMPWPWLATASDGGAKVPSASQPHPRSFGTFPRKLGFYAIDQQVIPLAAAIRSCSGLPAEILGLQDRGWLKAGMAADIAVFDPETFRDQATFHQPYLPPIGIRHVLVNGQLAVYSGQATGRLSGVALRRPGNAQPAAETAP